MKLQLKFKEDVPAAQRDQIIEDLSARGVDSVRPLFPDTTDQMRGSLYVVDMNGDNDDRLLEFLQGLDAVEFAEPEVRRKLAKR